MGTKIAMAVLYLAAAVLAWSLYQQGRELDMIHERAVYAVDEARFNRDVLIKTLDAAIAVNECLLEQPTRMDMARVIKACKVGGIVMPMSIQDEYTPELQRAGWK